MSLLRKQTCPFIHIQRGVGLTASRLSLQRASTHMSCDVFPSSVVRARVLIYRGSCKTFAIADGTSPSLPKCTSCTFFAQLWEGRACRGRVLQLLHGRIPRAKCAKCAKFYPGNYKVVLFSFRQQAYNNKSQRPGHLAVVRLLFLACCCTLAVPSLLSYACCPCAAVTS